MRPRIVATHNTDINVTVTRPMMGQMRWMTCGGSGRGHGVRGFLEYEIEKFIKDGRIPDAAARFCKATHFGGCTSTEALAIIRDHDVAYCHHDIILMDAADLPERAFRNAWVRTPNGGVAVDMRKARRIQLDKIKTHIQAANHRRLLLRRRLITPMWSVIGRAVRHARDADELKKVWVQ